MTEKTEILNVYCVGFHRKADEFIYKKHDLCGFGVKGILKNTADGNSQHKEIINFSLQGLIRIQPGKCYLNNVELTKKTKETSQLTAIGEAILQLLEHFRTESSTSYKHICFRCEDSYLKKVITGAQMVIPNINMIKLIRSHWNCLMDELRKNNITVDWNFSSNLPDQNHMDDTFLMAQMGAEGKKNKYAKFRNNLALNLELASKFLHPGPIDTDASSVFTQIDPNMLPTQSLYNNLKDLNILQIPEEMIGVLLMLCSTSKYIRNRQRDMLRNCFNFILNKLSENSSNSLWWKKFLFLPRVLLTPLAPNLKWTFKERCNWILADDWSNFKLSNFKLKGFYNGNSSAEKHKLNKVRRSKNRMLEGEISRSWSALQSEFCEVSMNNEDIQLEYKKLFPSKNSTNVLINPSPHDLQDISMSSSSLQMDINEVSNTHPHINEDYSQDTMNQTSIKVSCEMVKKMILSIKNGITNCQTTSLRPELLKCLLGNAHNGSEINFLEGYTWFNNCILQGTVPKDIHSILRDTQGSPITKKDGSIRPVALREGFTNYASRLAIAYKSEQTQKIFQDVNYALSGSKGMDKLIGLCTHSFISTPEKDKIFIDCSNAFNNIDRDIAEKSIKENCPDLLAIFNLLYSEASFVWLKDDITDWKAILIEMGCVQGCVLGPYIFGFASLELYKSIQNILKDKDNSFFAAFSDDSFLSANHVDSVEAFKLFINKGPSCGLHVNFKPGKTVVLLGTCNSQVEVQQRINAYTDIGFPINNIKIHPSNGGAEEEYGYIHLGVPQGSEAFQKQQFSKIVDEFKITCSYDDIVDEAQHKWIFLTNIIQHKVAFWFRHLSPNISSTCAAEIDSFIKKKLNIIMGNDNLTDGDYDGAFLPIKQYGLGLHYARDSIAAAFLGNYDEIQEHILKIIPKATYLIEIQDDLGLLSPDIEKFVNGVNAVKNHIDSTLNVLQALGIIDKQATLEKGKSIKKKKQKFYSMLIDKVNVRTYEESISNKEDVYDQTRLVGIQGDWASAWLHSIPQNKELTMTSLEFRHALHLRLGIEFQERPNKCFCKNQHIFDKNMSHALSCSSFSESRYGRHEEMSKQLKVLGTSAHISVSERGLSMENKSRPDLRFHCFGEKNRDLDIDTSIIFSGGGSYLKGRNINSSKTYVIARAEAMKNETYLLNCNENGRDFLPIVFDAFGLPSETTIKFVSSLVKRASEVSFIPHHILSFYWKKRISTCLQRSNSRIIINATKKVYSKAIEEEDLDYGPNLHHRI